MTGVVTTSTLVLCMHGFPATAVVSSPRVSVGGAPVVTVTAAPSYQVACGVPAPPPAPCVTANWITGSQNVFSNGLPVAIESGTSLCQPSLVRLEIASNQQLVTAS